MKFNCDIDYINSKIGNIEYYLDHCNLTLKSRQSLEFKLDNLYARLNYLENKSLQENTVNKHTKNSTNPLIYLLTELSMLIIYIILCLVVMYI